MQNEKLSTKKFVIIRSKEEEKKSSDTRSQTTEWYTENHEIKLYKIVLAGSQVYANHERYNNTDVKYDCLTLIHGNIKLI